MLEKQRKQKRINQLGNVQVPSEAFMKMLKMDDDGEWGGTLRRRPQTPARTRVI
ncbi:MAG: hypothetical protein ACLS6G_13990 [Christensenellales bacterium]